jgi:multidrug resistance efflux pump
LETLQETATLTAAQTAQMVADARDAVRDAQQRVNNLNFGSKQTDIDQAFANLVLAEDRLDKARDNFEPYENKAEDNLVRAALLSALAQAQSNYDAAQRLYNNLTGAANDIDLSQAEADLAYAQALLVKLENDYADQQDGPDPDTLALAQARLENAIAQVAAAQAALDDLSLTAPFDGTVSIIYVRQSEWVNPGQPILLIGDLQNLQIETTDLNEIDVARISVGNRATITFDALPDSAVEGTVVRIGTKAASGSSVNYTVIIEMDEIPAGLLWDMTAFIDIEVNE